MLIDIHAHLDHPDFDKDREDVLNSKGVTIITSGINPETNRQALEMAKSHENVKCTLGIYPKEAFEEERKQIGDHTS